MGIRKRLSNLQVLRLTIGEILWVSGGVFVSKVQGVANYVYLLMPLKVRSFRRKGSYKFKKCVAFTGHSV